MELERKYVQYLFLREVHGQCQNNSREYFVDLSYFTVVVIVLVPVRWSYTSHNKNRNALTNQSKVKATMQKIFSQYIMVERWLSG